MTARLKGKKPVSYTDEFVDIGMCLKTPEKS